MGGFEAGALALVEPTVKYHPVESWCLTWPPDRGRGHWLVGSLTGAVASQIVTEARDGGLKLVGNQLLSAMA